MAGLEAGNLEHLFRFLLPRHAPSQQQLSQAPAPPRVRFRFKSAR
jgi:hypothetical protein